MTATKAQVGFSDPSVRVYAALVRLYPRRHRRAYGPAMVQLFRDQVRDARASGARELLSLFLRTVVDLIGSVAREHGSAIRIGEPLGGWRYPRALWWQALLAAMPGLLLIAGDQRLFRLVFPRVPYPHPAVMPLLAVAGCLAIMVFAIVRERRLADWAFPAAGVFATYLPYAAALVWRDGAGPVWSSIGIPLIVLILGSFAGMATVVRHRLGSGALPRWAWMVAGLSLVVLGAHAIHEASYTHPWRWETVLMVQWRWLYFTLLLGMPLLCAATIAPTRGTRAVLLVLPVAVWWSVGMVVEPAQFAAARSGDRLLQIAVDQLPAAVLLVGMPVALLRVRTAAYQAMALLMASIGTMLAVELLCIRVLPTYGAPALSICRGGMALQLAVSMAFVTALFDALARATQMDWVV